MSLPSSRIIIAPLDPADVAELADLAARTFSDAFGPSMSPAELSASLQSMRSVEYFEKTRHDSVILVAKRDGQIVGYTQFGSVKLPEVAAGPADREFGRLYIETALQGYGIGRQLALATLAHPEMLTAPNIYLQVWEQNPRAIALYESLGFKRTGQSTHFTLGDNTPAEDLIMVRRQAV